MWFSFRCAGASCDQPDRVKLLLEHRYEGRRRERADENLHPGRFALGADDLLNGRSCNLAIIVVEDSDRCIYWNFREIVEVSARVADLPLPRRDRPFAMI
jgi:hypothetical protein